jgi:maleate cis-trans isomerase
MKNFVYLVEFFSVDLEEFRETEDPNKIEIELRSGSEVERDKTALKQLIGNELQKISDIDPDSETILKTILDYFGKHGWEAVKIAGQGIDDPDPKPGSLFSWDIVFKREK